VKLQSTRGYGEELAAEAELVAQALKNIGIAVDISMVDYDSFIPAWRDGKFDHLLYTFLGYGYDADDWLLTPFHSKFNGTKYFGYKDPELDTILDAQASEPTRGGAPRWPRRPRSRWPARPMPWRHLPGSTSSGSTPGSRATCTMTPSTTGIRS
jgi:ABC-type transport system substrate-binding protein